MVDETGAGASSCHRQETLETLLLAIGILRALVSEMEAVELLSVPIFSFALYVLAAVLCGLRDPSLELLLSF